MLSEIQKLIAFTALDTPPSLNPYLNGRKGPPLTPGVKIKMPIEPSPYEKHLLYDKLITPQYLTQISAIESTVNEFTTPYTLVDLHFNSTLNNYTTTGKRTQISNIIEKLQESNGSNPKLFYTRRNMQLFSPIPINTGLLV